jgi:tRNA dimethylallyltransferase
VLSAILVVWCKETENILVANLLFVVGPTASGKTDLAIEIAKVAGAEIISADSVQFYRELVIGSARPTDEQLREVRHHFVGHVSVAEDYTAGAFERDALELISENPSRPFVVCGGSGFYIQALQYGMYPIEKADLGVQERIERDIDTRGLEAVYEDLKRQDPETAEKISVQDRYRIVRSLEVLASLNGEKLSDVRRRFEASRELRFKGRKIQNFAIHAERQELQSRVEIRTEQMLKNGLVQEVTALVEAGMGSRPALQSVGYKETLAHLQAGGDMRDLAAEITKGTLRLAKKQRTWFSRLASQQPEKTRWIELGDLQNPVARQRLVQEGAEFLSKS